LPLRSNALPPRATALLLALAAALLLLRLGDVPLLGPDEPRYARVAAEMARRGDLVTPTLQGLPWLEKPALYYWLAGGAFALFGENEAAARLPSVLAGLLLVGATAVFGARVYGAAAGLHAGFILATSVLPFAYARAASMDMLLAAWATAAVGFAGLRLLGVAGRGAVIAAGACAGLAVLAKGPLGLLLPALVAGGYALARRDGRPLRQLAAPGAALAFLVVTLPWYLAILAAQGRAFVDVFFLDHNLARFTTTVHRHPGPFYYYLPVLLLGLVPWTGFLLPACSLLRMRRPAADLYVALWLLLPLAFFSMAGSKLPGYVLPCLPPLALLMGRAAGHLAAGGEAPRGTGRTAVATVTGLVAAVLLAAGVVLRSRGDAAWLVAVPLGLWSGLTAAAFADRAARDMASAIGLLRVGAAGLLVLIAIAAPPLLDARESGRSLFEPARGQEVLAWDAWRTAWMAGYWYNDGKVRPVASLDEVTREVDRGAALVLCDPGRRRQLEHAKGLRVRQLAAGPRGHALLRVERPRAVTLP
jgi:4-amino-4-deoxy-L-arabinose transferase-like glycosyltransferase